MSSSLARGTGKQYARARVPDFASNDANMVIDDSAEELNSIPAGPKTLEDESSASYYGQEKNLQRAAHLSRLIA